MSGYINAMRRYFEFGGRSSRSEFWFFVLFYVIIIILAAVLDAVIFGSQGGIGILYGIVALAHLVPAIAVSVRRLHDIDRTGWWVLFFVLVPIIIPLIAMGALGGSLALMMGSETDVFAGMAAMGIGLLVVALVDIVILIVAIIFYATPGTPGPNRFGPPPV